MKKIPASKTAKNTPASKPAPTQTASTPKSFLILAGILLLTGIAYMPALRAGFIDGWDDDAYVTENVNLRSVSTLKELLTTPVQGNYHPLTMLSLAINYAISGEKAWSYHLLNVLLHLVNTLLVFRFARTLSKGNVLIGGVTAMLFALHPMHVESVAWVAERKDVLYALFFLLGLNQYLAYVDADGQARRRKAYFLVLLCFLCSLASKPAAVIFPIALFSLDFFRSRKLSLALFTEKAPLLAISLLFGYLTLHAQQEAMPGAEQMPSLLVRLLYVCYGSMTYFAKMFFPVDIAAFYPFPMTNAPLPAAYWASPVFALLAIATVVFAWKKYPAIAFGLGFFAINLALVLQFVPVGSAIIAARYSYLPYLGLSFSLAWLLHQWAGSKSSRVYAVAIPVSLLLAGLSYIQAGTWKSSVALWENTLRTNPSHKAYYEAAHAFEMQKDYAKAIRYNTEALKLNVNDPNALGARADVYVLVHEDALALADYNALLALKPNHIMGLENRGVLLAKQGKLEQALADFDRELTLQPDKAIIYKNRGAVLSQIGKFEETIASYKKYLALSPNDADVLNDIGLAEYKLGRYQPSLEAYSAAIRLKKMPLFYLNRAYPLLALGQKDAAKKDALYAREQGLTVPGNLGQLLGL